MLFSLHLIRPLLILATIILMCLPAAAAPVDLVQSGELSGEALGLRFLHDPQQSLTVGELAKLPDAHFAALGRRDVNQRLQRGDYWLKTSVRNATGASITSVLRHPMPLTDYVDYWIVSHGVLVAHARGGDRTLAAERQLPYRIASIRHTFAAGQDAQVYIRMRNMQASPMHLAFALSDETAYLKKMADDQLSMGLFYGIPFALAVYALVGWCISGNRGSLIYAGYVFAVMGSWLGINGQLADYVFVNRPDIANFMLVVFFLLATIANCMFVREFLQTKQFMPRFDTYFAAVIALATGGIVLQMLGWHVAAVQLAIALLLTHAITPIVAIVALRGRALFARWYLASQLVYGVALIVGIVGLRYAGLSYDNYFFYCQLAFIAELALLGVAQHDRLRILQRQKATLEHKYRSALQINNAELASQLEQRAAFMAAVKTTTGRIANGEFDVRLAPGASPELSELAHNVNLMAASLSRLDGARKRWIAAISHELRMPLFSLQCETEALLDGVRTINRRAVVSLHEEVLRLARLVSDLHEVALTYLRPLPCTFAPWDLAPLLARKQHGYVRSAQEKGLRFTLDVPPGALPVTWDQGRFEQLLENLVQNSISYTDAPGAVALSVTASAERVHITLADTVPGIAPAEARQLFEPLFRADSARSRRAGGSGLGLSICQAIVHAHHGNIAAAPSPMGGLAIHIDLPRSADQA